MSPNDVNQNTEDLLKTANKVLQQMINPPATPADSAKSLIEFRDALIEGGFASDEACQIILVVLSKV